MRFFGLFYAATGLSQVKALVYVDAYVPDEGQALVELTGAESCFHVEDLNTILNFVPFPGALPGASDAYVKQDVEKYKLTVQAMARTLFDRDTAPGAEPEDLMRLDIPALIVPGRDAAHATSAARYLEECLPRSQYWDVPVEGQTEAPTAARVLEFLAGAPRP